MSPMENKSSMPSRRPSPRIHPHTAILPAGQSSENLPTPQNSVPQMYCTVHSAPTAHTNT